jgi:hypothetical protein
LIGNASGQDAERAINCSEGFSIRKLEGRALAVVGAAMDLWARLGTGERGEES